MPYLANSDIQLGDRVDFERKSSVSQDVLVKKITPSVYVKRLQTSQITNIKEHTFTENREHGLPPLENREHGLPPCLLVKCKWNLKAVEQEVINN